MTDEKKPPKSKGKVVPIRDLRKRWIVVQPVVPEDMQDRLTSLGIMDKQGYLDIMGLVAAGLKVQHQLRLVNLFAKAILALLIIGLVYNAFLK